MALALAFLLVPVSMSPQSTPEAPQIHISTHLVQIGVIVRDSNGPVGNLAKDDFVVLDRGKPQPISVFSAETRDAEAQLGQPLPQNTFSDLPQYGAHTPRSVTVILLDNLNTLSGSSPQPYESTPYWLEDHALANAKQRLMEFLNGLDSRDRIAIYGLSESLHVLCDFTCDRAQLLAVVSKYDATAKTRREAVEPGQFHTPVPESFNGLMDADAQRLAALNNRARAEVTMAALKAIAVHAADIPGRKNLLWLTANLPFSGKEIARLLGPANIAAYPVDARGLLPHAPLVSMEDNMDEDAYARGELGTPAQSSQPIGIGTMLQMAEDTGGHAFINTNDLTGAIRKVVEDTAVTYTLGFYLDTKSLDGKFHELRVQLKQPGLTVGYPKGYFAFRDTSASQDERHNSFLAAIRSPFDSAAIPLQVKVDRAIQPTANSLSLFGSVGIQGLHLEQKGETHAGAIDVTVLEQDKTGKILRESANRINLRFTEKQLPVALKSGITFRKSVQTLAGVTTLRILVQDAGTSAIGSLIIPLAQVN